jgi:hypothetical protein
MSSHTDGVVPDVLNHFLRKHPVEVNNPRMENSWNNFTVTLRVAKCDRKETRFLGVQMGTLSQEDICTEAWSSMLGVRRKHDDIHL